MNTLFSKYVLIIFLATCSGCTTYAQFTGDFRTHVASRNYTQALENLNTAKKGNNKLLYLLETGLIAHYQQQYEKSNRYFAAAEKHANELYTKSVTRQAVALITNDAIKKYRGESFELVAIHYYRALNYWYLGQPEDALVECRKANLKLAQYAIHNGETSYKNDAFIHYITGLFYEATGEYNDAYISYQHAQDAYEHYASEFQIPAPQTLESDLQRVSESLNGVQLVSLDPTAFLAPASDGELVIFSEVGFVPRKLEEEIDLPIYDNDIKRSKKIKTSVLAKDISDRRHRVRHVGNVEYWLQVALPKYDATPPQTNTVYIRSGEHNGQTTLAQNYASIAQTSLNHHYPGILAKTTARAFVKYLAYRKAKKENKVLGFLTNLLNVSTEIADTRSWVSLPHNIQIGRLALTPGTHTVTLEARDINGNVIETKTIENVEINPGQRTFISHRFYR
ncbi:MAG: hypothetical protein HOE48_18925 [Candidatus Latescibacteria bacterium]|jgi:uncharacterized protein|nr:hypothetical protein [Candidatus Latescibacterota bacterium]